MIKSWNSDNVETAQRDVSRGNIHHSLLSSSAKFHTHLCCYIVHLGHSTKEHRRSH